MRFAKASPSTPLVTRLNASTAPVSRGFDKDVGIAPKADKTDAAAMAYPAAAAEVCDFPKKALAPRELERIQRQPERTDDQNRPVSGGQARETTPFDDIA